MYCRHVFHTVHLADIDLGRSRGSPGRNCNPVGFQVVKGGGDNEQVFQRGRTNVTSPSAVEWRSLPVTLTVTHSGDSSSAKAVLFFEAPKTMEFSKDEAARFHCNSESDSDCLMAYLNSLSDEQKYIGVTYNNPMMGPVPTSLIRQLLPNAIVSHLGFQVVKGGDDNEQVFQRGRTNVTSPSAVEWRSLPVTLTVTHSGDVSSAKAVLFFEAPKTMEFSKDEAARFHRDSQSDIDSLLAYLKSPSDEREEDEDDEADPDDDNCIADFERLGLEPDASWKEVKKAYRKLCLKYHPDPLASQKLPKHIEELVVERFRETSDAYQRLREYYGE